MLHHVKQIPFMFKISILFIILFSATTAHSADVVLSWDRPNDSRVTGYKIFYGLAGSDFKSTPEEIIDSPAQTACDIYGLKNGNTYGFAAKSFDKNGNESIFSEQIFYDVPESQNGKSSDGGGGGCFINELLYGLIVSE